MAEYKVGDKVLVEARIDYVYERPAFTVYEMSAGQLQGRVNEKYIRGLAPKPETDWNSVPFGARVTVNDGRAAGRYLCYEPSKRDPHYVFLDDDIAFWFSHCELIED